MKTRFLLLVLSFPLTVSAAVYKCDDGGRVVYMDRPCMYEVKEARPQAQNAPTALPGERRERNLALRVNAVTEDLTTVAARPYTR
jgi:hypothetical protein